MKIADLIEQNTQLKQQYCLLESAYSTLETQYQTLQTRLDEFDALKQQLAWFKNQLFGQKSEKQFIPVPEQGSLFERLAPLPVEPEPSITVPAHQRSKKQRSESNINETGLRFDANVPTEVIDILPRELAGPEADQFDIVGYDEVAKLAKRPGSYVILLQRIAKVRRKSDLSFLPSVHAPGRVIDGSCIDVSFLAGMLVDKGCYHIPLYREHQRLRDAGVQISRSSLTNWSNPGIELLRPIFDALKRSVLQSKVLAMDEVPMKAGRAGQGKMQQTYFWPMYGDQDEVVFTWSKFRGHQHALDQLAGFSGTLLTDGYKAYEKTVVALNKQTHQVTHAQCWVHTRRYFFQAKDMEPQLAQHALDLIAKLYQLEAQWREQHLQPDEVIENRRTQSEPIVREFFAWVDHQLQDLGLLPSNPITKALSYARKRADCLKVFLANPFVQLDTNHLERALRVIPMGRKNFLFCWSEMGAEQLGILQSVLVTCRLHDVNPYEYLVDVLQRINILPATQVSDLIPRVWKQKFAEKPLRSLLNQIDDQGIKTSKNEPYRVYV